MAPDALAVTFFCCWWPALLPMAMQQTQTSPGHFFVSKKKDPQFLASQPLPLTPHTIHLLLWNSSPTPSWKNKRYRTLLLSNYDPLFRDEEKKRMPSHPQYIGVQRHGAGERSAECLLELQIKTRRKGGCWYRLQLAHKGSNDRDRCGQKIVCVSRKRSACDYHTKVLPHIPHYHF